MNRRVFLSFWLGAGATSLSGCTSTETISAYGSPAMLSIREKLLLKVEVLPNSKSKTVSIALLNRRDTKFYIDEHDLPAARWRGADNIGACVHIRPQTNQPYLETQFSSKRRSGKAPKYIQFGHEGDWYSRRHNRLDKLIGTEKNWRDANSEQQGKELLEALLRALS